MKVKDIIDYVYMFTAIDVWDNDQDTYVAKGKDKYELKEFYDYEILLIKPVSGSTLRLTISKD